MELKDFISSAIKDIVDAVAESQEYVVSKGGTINPDCHPDTPKRLRALSGEEVQIVEFDAVVTATESKDKKGGIGVRMAIVSLGGDAVSSSSNQSETRIKFSIPLVLPRPKVPGF